MVAYSKSLLFLILLCVGSAQLGCMEDKRVEKPDNLIPEDKYVDLLVEFQIISSYAQKNDSTFNRSAAEKAVLKKYEVTAEQYEASHKYYEQDLDAQIERIDEAINRIEEQEDELESN